MLPDLRYDVDAIADYLTLKLGATKEEVTASATKNKMSGGDMQITDCAFSQVMTAKGKLREWISTLVKSGDLFERNEEEQPPAEAPEGENVDSIIQSESSFLVVFWRDSSTRKR